MVQIFQGFNKFTTEQESFERILSFWGNIRFASSMQFGLWDLSWEVWCSLPLNSAEAAAECLQSVRYDTAPEKNKVT